MSRESKNFITIETDQQTNIDILTEQDIQKLLTDIFNFFTDPKDIINQELENLFEDFSE